jgi:hypothetical protein
MTKGVYAIMLNNKGDKLSMYKNLWLHIACAPELNKQIEEAVNRYGPEIAALQL